ncbi:MAG: ABC transporter ATP-binding protein [Planctomycetota bacterium]
MTQDVQSTVLAAEGLKKSFGRGAGRVDVLRGLDLEVRRGEFLAVMGPSGCGKSTLLHVLGLITPPDAGAVAMDGRPVPASDTARTRLRRTQIGLVFQRLNLLSMLSAEQNLEVSQKVRGLRLDGRVRELVEAMGVSHVARRKPGEMSIGEQQRVAVVRALAHDPALLLADEPTGSLDSENSETLLGLLQRINRERQQTIVMITHSPEAAAFADRVVRMKDGQLIAYA